jgi:hypothetical protein
VIEARRQEWFSRAFETHCVTNGVVVQAAPLGLTLIAGIVFQVADATTMLIQLDKECIVALTVPDSSVFVDGSGILAWGVRRLEAYRFVTVLGAARQVARYDLALPVELLSLDRFLIARQIPSIAALCPPPLAPMTTAITAETTTEKPRSVGVSPHAIMRQNPSRLLRPGEMR